MATKLNKAQKELLNTIIAATNSPAGFTYANPSDAKVNVLVEQGLIELNSAVTDGNGGVGVRASASALASVTAPAATSSKPSFEIVTGIAPAVAKRGGVREEIYPFSKLEIGASFFIPASEKHPNPAESFASTVTSAIRRFSVETGNMRKNRKGEEVKETKPTRKFVIRAVTAGQTYSNGFVEAAAGARIFRTE
jgi:hypothetical protein